ncbi:DegT/DnrJ/EryC1/StrS family aminotransferase [Bythopirellula goksoeyrii]|uniref:DegT/DnrJ/EryC1/StrS family aminotransferase n=1 Tax=Bythopirellula goksoeyrii TaxID=1400387 RepID=UPI0021BC79E6|nr:DegT/DnrJ/EryC1/StrS family aminotransferase [Bythopirellula goksoeyrii]
MGSHVDDFQREFAEKRGVSHAVAFSRGTAALLLALLAAGVGPGDVVITSTLTFAVAVNAIRYVGAEPVFIDRERRNWNRDPLIARRRAARGRSTPAQGSPGGRRVRPIRRLGPDARNMPSLWRDNY